jgi:hypothetical protein
VRFAVRDRSGKVRAKPAERIDVLELDLLEELREQVRVETHRVTREKLEWHLGVRTLGYHVEHDDEGRPQVWARNGNGWVGVSPTPRDIVTGRVHELIAAARESNDRMR